MIFTTDDFSEAISHLLLDSILTSKNGNSNENPRKLLMGCEM